MSKKNKFSSIFYTVFYSVMAFITVVLVISFSVWAAKGGTMEQLNVIEGEVLLSEDGVRDEYLVGQSIDSAGVSLKAGNKIFTTDELEFSVDNASAGSKTVEVFHRDGNDYYRGYYLVTYFAVRHLDMHKAPTGISFDADGNATVQGMELWAELSGKPTSFRQPDDPSLETVIILDESNYTLEVDPQDELGGYTAKINCGKHSVSIYFVEVSGEMVILESPNRIATFTNERGTGETLTLYITSRGSDTPNHKINVAEGFFIYRDANGTHKYTFNYTFFDETGYWASVFSSDDLPGSIYRRNPDGEDELIVQIGDLIFSTSSSSWRLAILNS